MRISVICRMSSGDLPREENLVSLRLRPHLVDFASLASILAINCAAKTKSKV